MPRSRSVSSTPLGLTHTGTLPEEALLHRAAVGHVSDVSAEPERAPVWDLPRSLGPAGLDQLDRRRRARLRPDAPGRRPRADGTRVLAEAAPRRMTEYPGRPARQVPLGDSWGLGWIRFGWDGRRLIGHDGNTIGQAAFLRVLPDEGSRSRC